MNFEPSTISPIELCGAEWLLFLSPDGATLRYLQTRYLHLPFTLRSVHFSVRMCMRYILKGESIPLELNIEKNC